MVDINIRGINSGSWIYPGKYIYIRGQFIATSENGDKTNAHEYTYAEETNSK